jgi:hypothetical protein
MTILGNTKRRVEMQRFDVSKETWALIVINGQVDYCDEEKGSRLVQGVAGDPAMEVATDNIAALIVMNNPSNRVYPARKVTASNGLPVFT